MLTKELRARAEDAVRLTRHDVSALASDDVQRLVHELQVHQVELEMQNESLGVAQEELEASHEQYRELFDCAPTGYLLLDINAEVVRANAAALALLNVARIGLIARRLSAWVLPEDHQVLQEHVGRAVYEPGRTTCEVRMRAPNGSTKHMRLDTSRLPSRVAQLLTVMTDVTERTRDREALARAKQELEVHVAFRTAELTARNRELEAEMQRRARTETLRRDLESRLREEGRLESLALLAAGIAHDFNNLLVSVLGHADLLLMTPGLPDEFQEPLGVIQRASRGATELTNQLLVFAGRGNLAMAPVSLPLMVANSMELLRQRAGRGIQLQTRITNDVPSILADRGQVQRVVINLVLNAIEALKGNGVVQVETHAQSLSAADLDTFQHQSGTEPGDFAIVRIEDSGPGIDPAILPRIFDPFFTTKFMGRGLGLATVLGIANSHHGAVRVRTHASEGACFEVAFPLAPKSEPDNAQLGDADWTGTGSVLLVDDDDGVRKVVAKQLERLGFQVTAANGGRSGIELFRAAKPGFDFVVLDWIMPDISGEQVLNTLRQLQPDLPVVLISGYSASDLVTLEEHVARVQKPMSLAQLRDAVRSVTGTAALRRLRPQA